MPKLVWENNRQVPPAKNVKSHMRHYVPRGRDAFDQTYHHMMRIGAFKLQERAGFYRLQRLEGAQKIAQRILAKRNNGRVVAFDNTGK